MKVNMKTMHVRIIHAAVQLPHIVMITNYLVFYFFAPHTIVSKGYLATIVFATFLALILMHLFLGMHTCNASVIAAIIVLWIIAILQLSLIGFDYYRSANGPLSIYLGGLGGIVLYPVYAIISVCTLLVTLQPGARLGLRDSGNRA